MIDRDKDPCASKQQDVPSQFQVTRRGMKKSLIKHKDFMRAMFFDPEPRGGRVLSGVEG
jgi:hypothetical protein